MVERTIISAFNRLIRKKMAYTQGRSIAATIKHGQHNDEAVVLAGIGFYTTNLHTTVNEILQGHGMIIMAHSETHTAAACISRGSLV